MQAPSVIVHGVVPSEGGGAGFGFGLVVVVFGGVVVVVVSGGGGGGVVVVGSTVVVVVVGAGDDALVALFWLATAPPPHAASRVALPARVTPTISFLTRMSDSHRPPDAAYAQDDVSDQLQVALS